MALTESIEYDKIEIVTPYNSLQIRKATIIKKDDVEISRTFHRYVLQCGSLDESDNFVDNPLDKETDGITAIPDNIKNIAAVVWTTDIKNAYKAKLIADKPASE
tara:strand:+ start:545 stop:856 length:312 start_codon:yes stop_codon:yes gene_type:complete